MRCGMLPRFILSRGSCKGCYLLAMAEIKHILVLPGDGIGPEIVAEAVGVLEVLRRDQGLNLDISEGLVGGAAIDLCGDPLPPTTLEQARAADAILLGAVGGPKWEGLEIARRPEKGLLGLRSQLGLFANLRPAVVSPHLAAASMLKPEAVAGLNLLIVRELTGDIYFGQPRGVRKNAAGEREGFNTMVYAEHEIERIARVAFDLAMQRGGRVCSIDKANVLEATELWREVVATVARDYPELTLTHMYVDNAAMQMVRAPRQFDVLLTGNMFGDILSDLAAAVTGSIGMLPSASLNERRQGLYEPIHGSAPDIAGKDLANPLATILSVAMLLRYSLDEAGYAARIEAAVDRVLAQGLRTRDIAAPGEPSLGTRAMGAAVCEALGAIG